jgi:acyl-CoA thioester hydrolase
MPKFAVTYRGTVYPWQCDHMGHMNVMWYVGKFDEASWQLLSALGLSATRLRRENAGMAAVEQNIEYKREVHAGDITTVRSTVLEVTDKSLRLIHEMRNDSTGEVVAVTATTGVYFDATLRKARPLPSDVRMVAELMISSDDAKRAATILPVTEESLRPAPVGSDDTGNDSTLLC